MGSRYTFALLTLAGALSAEPRKAPLGELSLEELLQVKITSVERRELSLGRSASAVYVITREQIERSYAATVPDLLRRVPGLQVAQIDANKWAVGGRGSNSRYANKILVLVDGRSVLNHLAGGVYWEQNDLMVEDIERIEVIRGPGSTRWGVGAVNGVINIITRRTADTMDALVSVRAGQTQPLVASVRHGARLSEQAEYRLFAKRLHGGPSSDAHGQAAPDLWRTSRAGGRLEWRPGERDNLRFQADAFAGNFQGTLATYPHQLSSFLPITIPTLQENGRYSGGYGLVRWDRSISQTTSLAVQSSYQQDARDEVLGNSRAGAFDTMALWNARRSRHDLTGGVNLRLSHDRVLPNIATYRPPSWMGLSSSAFLQYDLALSDNLLLTLGSKFLREPFDGSHIEPTARLSWNASSRQSIWTAVSRSVRPPNRRERDLEINLDPPHPFLPVVRLAGSPDFRSEELLAVEAGYRYGFRRVDLDIASYFGRIQGNNTSLFQPLTRDSRGRSVLPIIFANTAQSTSFGLEAATTWRLTSRWQALLNYTYAERYTDGASLTSTGRNRVEVPRHQATLISDYQLSPKVTWQQSVYFVDELAGLNVPAYWRLDTALSVRLGRRWQASIGGENLLQPRHLEMMSDDTTIARCVRRSAFARLVWTR